MRFDMPREKSENTFPLSFKVPEEWVHIADELAEAMSRPPVMVTRTDVARTALLRGLQAMKAERDGGSKPQKKR
jgi:hypothetical protein